MIYLSLDYGVPMFQYASPLPFYLLSLSLSLVVEKKIYVHSGSTFVTSIRHPTIFRINQGQAQLPLFDRRKSTRQIISTFVPDVLSPFFVTTLVNNDSISKRGREREGGGEFNIFVRLSFYFWLFFYPLCNSIHNYDRCNVPDIFSTNFKSIL